MLKKIPAAIVFRMSDPDLEILIDPGTGMEVVQMLGRWNGVQRRGKRRRGDPDPFSRLKSRAAECLVQER